MSTYLKFIVIAALFLTTGAASVLGESESSSSSTTDQETVEQSSSKRKEVKKSETSATKETETSADSSKDSIQSTAQSSSVNPAAATSSEESSPALIPEESETVSTEQNARPAPTVNEAEPANSSAPESTTPNAAAPQPTTMQANQLEIAGQLISYLNAGQGNGQAIIDANPNIVATWGGASVQSGNDGANTHFIGHNPGIFNVLFSVGVGETISVSDGANNVSNYTVSQTVTVDDSGMAEDGTDYWDQITSSGGGERISLQTCINDDYNLIVFANK